MELPSPLHNFLHRLFRAAFQKQTKLFEGIPGPQPIFPIGNIQEFVNSNTAQVLGSFAERYGSLSLMWTFSKPSLVLNDPHLMRQILLTKEQQSVSHRDTPAPDTVYENDFYKELPRKALCPMLTTTSTFITAKADAEWRYLSKNHPLHMSYFEEWQGLQILPLKTFLEECCDEFMAKSRDRAIAVYDNIRKLTFDGFALATLGKVLDESFFAHFLTMCDSGTQRMNLSSLNRAIIRDDPVSSTYQKASREWYGLFLKLVKEAKVNPPAQSLLALVTERGGTKFDDEQLSKVFAEAYPGGAISVPSGIANTLYLLEQHPQILAKLLAELHIYWQGEWTLERLEQCTNLDRVLRESLRLLPPVAFFLRNVERNCPVVLDGHEIPPDTQIYMTSWHLQRQSPYWGKEPETFRPERWDEQKLADYAHWEGDYFFPFGRGDRKCIGNEFAIYFMKVALAVMVPKVQLQFVPDAANTSDFIPQSFYFAVSVPSSLQATFISREQ
ncbi:MAG: cytochrome P450 [Cyanobacteria bacterium P01_D01_bin.123]